MTVTRRLQRFGQRRFIHLFLCPWIWRQVSGPRVTIPSTAAAGSIHRGRLHGILYAAALARLGAARIRLGHQCTGVEQDAQGASLRFVSSATQAPLAPARAEVVVVGPDDTSSQTVIKTKPPTVVVVKHTPIPQTPAETPPPPPKRDRKV